MSSSDQKLDEIILRLARIEKALDIVPDRETKITDYESAVNSYEKFAREMKLEQSTINNQKSTILRFLNHSEGIITEDTVKSYLESNESDSWKANQLKALRKYIRDYLKLGNWINEFDFAKTQAKIKEIPTDEQLARFCLLLPYQVQLVFLVLHNTGLRLGEVLDVKIKNIDFEINKVDASEMHKGDTKSSWISFFTQQTADYLMNYLTTDEFRADKSNYDNSQLFTVSDRYVQQSFKDTSEALGISVNPHLLRTVFAEKCTQAKLADKYIDAFCGRIPQSVLSKHYTDYSPQALRKQYDKVEPFLTLKISS